MAAGKCGCAGTTCSCVIKGDGVTGAGSVNNPYVITSGVVLHANSTETIVHTLLGDGSPSNPWTLTSVADLDFGDLADVDASVTTPGYVPARQVDGSFAMVPPSTAPAGAISAGNSIEGDGSGGDPLDVRLDALSGLIINTGGLALSPYTVATEGDLDTIYGALPVGSIVSDTDGSGVWLKTSAGWTTLTEDTGPVSGVGGNITAATGWTVTSFNARRRNGLVQVRVGITTTVTRTTTLDTGNLTNVAVATIIPTEFRPVLDTPFRVLSAGTDDGFYLTTTGGLALANLAQPDVVIPAGYAWNLSGTFIGA